MIICTNELAERHPKQARDIHAHVQTDISELLVSSFIDDTIGNRVLKCTQ